MSVYVEFTSVAQSLSLTPLNVLSAINNNRYSEFHEDKKKKRSQDGIPFHNKGKI